MPVKKRTPRKPGKKLKKKPPVGLERAIRCARAAVDKKAEELVLLDIRELSDFADYFVICHGIGGLHIKAIAENVIGQLRQAGVKLLSEEGAMESRWILLDFGDVVVHVFDESARGFYDLERLWIRAVEIELPEE